MSLLFRLALLGAMTPSALCSTPGLIDLAEESAVVASAEVLAESTHDHEDNGIKLLPAAFSSLPLQCCQLIPEFHAAGFAANLHTCEAQLESQARRAFATQSETDTPDVRVFFLQRDNNAGAGYSVVATTIKGRKSLDIAHVDAEGKSKEIIG